MELQIQDLMGQLIQEKGSDLHLSAGQPPFGRFNGGTAGHAGRQLSEDDCNRMIFSILNDGQRQHLEQTWELDCAYGLRDIARFRVNVL